MRDNASESNVRAMRLRNSSRLRQRAWRADALSQVPGAWVFVPIAGLYLSLLYKIPALGVAMLLAVFGCLPLMRYSNWRLDPLMASLALGYAGLATVTAFMVSFPAGVFRSLEFVFLSGAAFAIVIYFRNSESRRIARLAGLFACINILVLAHVIYFHISRDIVGAWKYLADAKFVFTAITFLLFYYEDAIKKYSWAAWAATLVAVLAVIVLSGERKALLFLVLAYLLSREKLWIKAALAALASGLVLTSSFAPRTGLPDFAEISSAGSSGTNPSNRYFLTRNLIDHSDETRLFVNRNAMRLFEENPVFGIGATGYATWAYRKYGPVAASGGLSMNVHGERHRIPAENGWIGILWVLAYLGCCVGRIGRWVLAKGGLAASSKDRAPAYALVMLVTYAYSEALDSTMLLLILLVGLWAAAIGHRSAPYRRGEKSWEVRPIGTGSVLA